jgi:hypothetical protein
MEGAVHLIKVVCFRPVEVVQLHPAITALGDPSLWAYCTGFASVHVTPIQADELQEENHVDSGVGFTDKCNRAVGVCNNQTGRYEATAAMNTCVVLCSISRQQFRHCKVICNVAGTVQVGSQASLSEIENQYTA